MKQFFTIFLCLAAVQSFSQQAIDTSHSITTKLLALDLDGSRHAYHPNNEGLDDNLNGGINKQEAMQNKFALTGNRGYGIAKKKSTDGKFYIGYLQDNGFFISQTTPYYKNKPESDPGRYADAETIPYIAYSPGWKSRGIKKGDIAWVVNTTNGKACAAIFADYRGNDREVEISLALADSLSIKTSTRLVKSYDGTKTVRKYVGIASPRLKIYFFPGSGNGDGKTAMEIRQLGKRLMGIEE